MVQPQFHIALLRNARNEWPRLCHQHSRNFWQSFLKQLDLIFAGDLCASKEEGSKFGVKNGKSFQEISLDVQITTDYDPVVLRTNLDPFWINGVLGKMVVMAFDVQSKFQ